VGTEAYDKALEALSKAAYETKSAAANTAATTYVKAKLYGENYDSYKTKAEESLKSNYYNDDGTVKETLAKKYSDSFDIMTQEDKEKLGVENMTKEEYIDWAAKKELDQEVAKKADADTTSFVNTKISTDSDVKLEIQAAAFAGKTAADIEGLSQVAKDKYYTTGVQGFDGTTTFTQDSVKADITADVSNYASITDRYETLSGSALSGLGLADVTVAADGTVSVNGGANDSSNTSIPSGMALIAASDSKIILNGAEMTSSSSVVSANGLEISLTGITKTDEPITFSITNDVDSVYNSVKSFLKDYNEIMKEMNTLLDAKSAKGYEPLTSEQKKEMSDDDIKLWEDKIKGSLLRNDSTLDGIVSGMRGAMMSQVTYEGKTYSLASFGIMTSTDYLEGGLLHIYGDKDDSVYADKDDKLRKALNDDPDAVINVLTGIFGNLKDTMSKKMAGNKMSSALTFYNDIKMKDDLKQYEKDIKSWEDRLASMEEMYYKKFTAMETALAKLQSQQNSLGSLFGGF
jgi:flagellar hook-associated protein 2